MKMLEMMKMEKKMIENIEESIIREDIKLLGKSCISFLKYINSFMDGIEEELERNLQITIENIKIMRENYVKLRVFGNESKSMEEKMWEIEETILDIINLNNKDEMGIWENFVRTRERLTEQNELIEGILKRNKDLIEIYDDTIPQTSIHIQDSVIYKSGIS